MGCPHEFAERVKELEPVWVGDLYSNVDIYFCEDCLSEIACKADTFQIMSVLSMGTDLHDNGSTATDEV